MRRVRNPPRASYARAYRACRNPLRPPRGGCQKSSTGHGELCSRSMFPKAFSLVGNFVRSVRLRQLRRDGGRTESVEVRPYPLNGVRFENSYYRLGDRIATIKSCLFMKFLVVVDCAYPRIFTVRCKAARCDRWRQQATWRCHSLSNRYRRLISLRSCVQARSSATFPDHSGSLSSGAISASGARTNLRFSMRGCGTCSSGVLRDKSP